VNLEFYPEKRIRQRPYYFEYNVEKNKVRLFKENWLSKEEQIGPFGDMSLVHPWNLDLEGPFLEKEFPYIVSFWTRPFWVFMVDSLNDKFEKQYDKN